MKTLVKTWTNPQGVKVNEWMIKTEKPVGARERVVEEEKTNNKYTWKGRK